MTQTKYYYILSTNQNHRNNTQLIKTPLAY